MIRTPSHWAKRGWPAVLLLPLSGLWAVAAWLRKVTARTRRAALPVICVGNLGAGGTGKTPIVSWLYDNLASRGWNPVILSRGYGGKLAGPAWVDGSSHDAAAIGDEPLMMAESRDVMVSRDRVAGARAIEAHGAHDVIIMDDGLQNPYLEKQLRIGVFDGGFGAPNPPSKTPIRSCFSRYGFCRPSSMMMTSCAPCASIARAPATRSLDTITSRDSAIISGSSPMAAASWLLPSTHAGPASLPPYPRDRMTGFQPRLARLS